MKKRTFRFAAAFAAAIMIFPVSAAGVQASETDPAQARASVTPAEELPEDYIREALADPSVETVRVSVLKSADTVPQDILNTLGEEDKTLTVAVYADASDQYPEYEWQFNGILGLDYVNGDFDLGVSIDLPDVREGAAEYIGDDSVPFTAFSLEQEGDIPNGAWLSLPVAGSMFELQNVYSYDREQGKLMSQNGSAGFSDNHSNGWWVTVRSFYDGGGDYIVTPSGLDYENKIYGDIEEAERKIMEKLQSDDPVVNIRMGYYWGNEYVLSTETLNAVRESGKTLNITWPGVEASATYIWTFHGSEMGEVTVPVNLLVLFRIGEHQHCHLADQVRHEKHHEPVELLSREKRLKIQERIVEHRERIAHDPRRLFLDRKHLVQLCHADQADGEQHQEQEISSCDHCDESNDHQ